MLRRTQAWLHEEPALKNLEGGEWEGKKHVAEDLVSWRTWRHDGEPRNKQSHIEMNDWTQGHRNKKDNNALHVVTVMPAENEYMQVYYHLFPDIKLTHHEQMTHL